MDAAKNFGLDALAGLRSMITKHISILVEYKFNYQWDVELESHPFARRWGSQGAGLVSPEHIHGAEVFNGGRALDDHLSPGHGLERGMGSSF